MAKAEVRRALSLATDRASIGTEVYGGTRRPADGIVAPGAEGYREGAWPYSRFDVAAARKALAKAGYPNGKGMPEVRLAYNSGGENEAVAKAIRTQWAAVGIRTKLEASAEFSEHLDRTDRGDFQVVRLGLRPDRPTHDAFLTTLFAGSSGDNVSGYSVDEVDAALATARATGDPEERQHLPRSRQEGRLGPAGHTGAVLRSPPRRLEARGELDAQPLRIRSTGEGVAAQGWQTGPTAVTSGSLCGHGGCLLYCVTASASRRGSQVRVAEWQTR